MKILSLIFFIYLIPLQLFAYIDPGSGSAILSAIIGFFVAIGIAVKTYWYKLKSIFARKNKYNKKP